MDFCKTEECFWREGAAAHEELMTGDCLMVFGPVGMLESDRIVESIRAAPRWSSVEMSNQILREHGGKVVILTYRARRNANATTLTKPTARRPTSARATTGGSRIISNRRPGWMDIRA